MCAFYALIILINLKKLVLHIIHALYDVVLPYTAATKQKNTVLLHQHLHYTAQQ